MIDAPTCPECGSIVAQMCMGHKLEQVERAARNRALEEAAKVADALVGVSHMPIAKVIAADIRALKETP